MIVLKACLVLVIGGVVLLLSAVGVQYAEKVAQFFAEGQNLFGVMFIGLGAMMVGAVGGMFVMMYAIRPSGPYSFYPSVPKPPMPPNELGDYARITKP